MRNLKAMSFTVSLLMATTLASPSAFAWGKRGHEIVASVAARILEEKRNTKSLSPFEFDLGYYTNVPDLIWRPISKEVETRERPQHYVDWNEDFIKAFGQPENLPLDFKEFKSKMGKAFDLQLGVAPYRIHDLLARCKDLAKDFSLKTQGPLLVCMGELSHYTGDLANPFHATANFDGQLTNQKGFHKYFESDVVDALDPQLKAMVLDKALMDFNNEEFQKHKNNPDALVRWLIHDSYDHVAAVLKIDKTIGRGDMKISKEKYKDMLMSRLSIGAIVTALLWEQVLAAGTSGSSPISQDIGFQIKGFYFFDGSPKYVEPSL